jgi:hypothetical protein
MENNIKLILHIKITVHMRSLCEYVEYVKLGCINSFHGQTAPTEIS